MELTFYEGAAERYGDALHVGAVLAARGTVTQHLEHGIGVEVAWAQVVEPTAVNVVPLPEVALEAGVL
jgi:coenzyme F420-reducing hydrogenase alpha subunit